MRLYSQEYQNKSVPIEGHRPTLSKRELESVLNCLIADQLNQGQVTRRFERSFSNIFGYRHTLALNSLTAGYHLAFKALEIGPQDQVILSALSPVAACDAARYTGASVHLVDLGQNSFHPSQEAILSLLTQIRKRARKDTKIVYVAEHSMGAAIPYSLEPIAVAGSLIVEDFTGLVGSEKKGNYFGKNSPLAICGLSEYDLITTGNGALLVTADPHLYKNMYGLRYGAKREPHSLAYDYRLGDFQAAMGIEQLSHLGADLSRRKKIGLRYLETLRSTQHETYFCSPEIDRYLRFPVLIRKDSTEVGRYFRSLQIGISRVTELPLHHLLGLPPLQFPNTERLFRSSVCVPLYPNLNAANVERIASALRGLI